jgi:hypothetical protein
MGISLFAAYGYCCFLLFYERFHTERSPNGAAVHVAVPRTEAVFCLIRRVKPDEVPELYGGVVLWT